MIQGGGRVSLVLGNVKSKASRRRVPDSSHQDAGACQVGWTANLAKSLMFQTEDNRFLGDDEFEAC